MKELKINRVWHQEHRMPVDATLDQRLKWHLEHNKNCGCRPMPIKIAEELKKSGISMHGTTPKRVAAKKVSRASGRR